METEHITSTDDWYTPEMQKHINDMAQDIADEIDAAVLKDMTEFALSDILEIIKCNKSPTYFINKYLGGDIDEELFDGPSSQTSEDNAIKYLLWHLMFYPNRTDVVISRLANNKMRDSIVALIETLPEFLKPILTTNQQRRIVFDNNSQLLIRAPSANSLRGFTINCLAVSENMNEKLHKEVIATAQVFLRSGHTKFISFK